MVGAPGPAPRRASFNKSPKSCQLCHKTRNYGRSTTIMTTTTPVCWQDKMLSFQGVRGRSRIWLRGGPNFFGQFLPTLCSSRANKVSPHWLGSRAHLRVLEALGFFITKYAFSPFWGTFLYQF